MSKELKSQRLIMNSFLTEDASRVSSLAGTKSVYELTANIPNPYTKEMAESWIISHDLESINNNYTYAIRLEENNLLIGCISLSINKLHKHGCVGYWIGEEYWSKGYCTEALKCIVKYAFSDLDVNKVWGEHKSKNIPSGRVMENVGMKQEGVLRKHFFRDGVFFDMSIKSILKSEYNKD